MAKIQKADKKIKAFGIKSAAIFLVLAFVSGCSYSETGSVDTFYNQGQKETEKTVTVSCAGDCTLGTDEAFGGITFNKEAENVGDYGYFLKNVKPLFESDDLTIVNFEGTLTERGVRQDKTFAFKGKPEYVKVLTEGSVEAVTLANNHSVDYGDISLADTKKYLEEAGIIWFENLNTAVTEVNGVKIGLVGLYALNGSAEGNLPKAMERVKNDGAAITVVQIHWGIEGDNYPDESQINLAHKAIDMGADLVIGHHPHVLQGIERYKGKIIAYSLGNFCFGGNQNPRDKDTMIYRQTFKVKDGSVTDYDNWAVVPASLSSVAFRNNYQPTVVEGAEKERIAEKIQKFSNPLGDLKIQIYGYDKNADTKAPSEGTKSGKDDYADRHEDKDSVIL